jgi:hypothetical protein
VPRVPCPECAIDVVVDPSGRCPEGHLVAPPPDPAPPTSGEDAAAGASPSAASSDVGDTAEGIDELAALEQAVGRPAAEGTDPGDDLDPVFARFAELMREREPEPEAGEDAPFTIWDGDEGEVAPAGQEHPGPGDGGPPAADSPSARAHEPLFPPRSAAVAPPPHAAPPPAPPAQAPPPPVPPPPPASGDEVPAGPTDDPAATEPDTSGAPTDDPVAADQPVDGAVDASTGEAPADVSDTGGDTGPPMSPLRDGWVGFTARSRPSPGRRPR